MYEQELPFNMDDFPNLIIKPSAESDKIIIDDDQKKKAAYQYLQSLEKNLRNKSITPQQRIQTMAVVLELYDSIFNKAYCNTLYKDSQFPSAESLEEAFNDEFDSITKLLYNENCYRHASQRVLQQFNLQISVEAWQNYQLLFTALQQKQNIELPLPPTWIWDILDEFVYQFYLASRWRKSLKNEELNTYKNLQDFWNFEEMIKILETLYNLRANNQQNTLQHLAHYAYLAATKLYVMSGNFVQAYQMISSIQYQDLIFYSKSGGAYQSLFSHAGFCLLLNKEYKKANLTLSLIVNYFTKYKQFFTKSYQYDSLIKQHEKILALLALSSLFYPELDDNVTTLLKESRNKLYEKYEKMLKFDLQVIGEVFVQASPKIIQVIRTSEQEPQDILTEVKERIINEAQEAKKINDVGQVLSLYNSITIEHFNKLIPQQYVEFYIARNNVQLNSNTFENELLSKFWQKSKLLDIVIEDNRIHVNEVAINQRDFINQLAQMNTNLEKSLLELGKNL